LEVSLKAHLSQGEASNCQT